MWRRQVITARKIFARVRNYCIYRIACTLQLIFFFFIVSRHALLYPCLNATGSYSPHTRHHAAQAVLAFEPADNFPTSQRERAGDKTLVGGWWAHDRWRRQWRASISPVASCHAALVHTLESLRCSVHEILRSAARSRRCRAPSTCPCSRSCCLPSSTTGASSPSSRTGRVPHPPLFLPSSLPHHRLTGLLLGRGRWCRLPALSTGTCPRSSPSRLPWAHTSSSSTSAW